MSNWVIGVDMGGTKIAIGLINPQDEIVMHHRMPTQQEDGPASVVERIGQIVDSFKSNLPSGDHIAALGLCAPGPLNHKTGVIINPTNLPTFFNTPLQHMLETRLGIPARIEHDAKAAALGEMYHGAGRGQNNLVYIVCGTGVGGAIIIEGELVRGPNNFAGEIGHTTINMHGEQCGCGSYGCVETYVAGPWIERRYAQLIGEAAPVLSGGEIAHKAAAGDPQAAMIMRQAGEALGVAIANTAKMFDVEFYIIGGSVVRAGDVLLKPARETLPKYSFADTKNRIKVVPAMLGEDGPILGCGWLARHAIK